MDKETLSSHGRNADGPAERQEGTDVSVSIRRRQLIKASAAAVPAVMTLRSGAAAAMASTYHCTSRDNDLALVEITETNDYVLDVTPEMPHDHWVRVAGKRVTTSGSNPVTIYCTQTGTGDREDAWQCFDVDGNELTTSREKPNLRQIENGDDVALLAFLNFNEYGDDTGDPVLYYPLIQAVQPAPPGYSPLTGSCLSSIHPNLTLPG